MWCFVSSSVTGVCDRSRGFQDIPKAGVRRSHRAIWRSMPALRSWSVPSAFSTSSNIAVAPSSSDSIGRYSRRRPIRCLISFVVSRRTTAKHLSPHHRLAFTRADTAGRLSSHRRRSSPRMSVRLPRFTARSAPVEIAEHRLVRPIFASDAASAMLYTSCVSIMLLSMFGVQLDVRLCSANVSRIHRFC